MNALDAVRMADAKKAAAAAALEEAVHCALAQGFTVDNVAVALGLDETTLAKRYGLSQRLQDRGLWRDFVLNRGPAGYPGYTYRASEPVHPAPS